MRILLSSTPAHGHVLPLLPLERAARRAGHTTAVLTHPSLADVAFPARLLPAGPTLEDLLTEVHRRTGADPARDMTPATVGEVFGGARVDMSAEEALRAAIAFRPDLVVAEAADQVGPLVAAALGVPWVSQGIGMAIEEPLADAMRTAAASRMAALGITPTQAVAAVDPWPDLLQRDGWTPPADRVPIRPEPHDSEQDHPDWARPEFPGREELPRVLVTLGTVVDDPKALDGIVDSLAALEVNVVVAVNPASETAPRAVDDSRVRVVGFVPMRRLLDGVDVVVSSGGAGTVLAALSSGIPMVLLPFGLDKPVNAERVSARGAGVVVGEPAEVGAAVARVLDDRSFPAAAQDTARRIAAMHSPEDVLSLLLQRLTADGLRTA